MISIKIYELSYYMEQTLVILLIEDELIKLGQAPIGTSGKTLRQIGCLARSISILIERSGAGKTIEPFTSQTFVQKMNKNGNLQYGAIPSLFPIFLL